VDDLWIACGSPRKTHALVQPRRHDVCRVTLPMLAIAMAISAANVACAPDETTRHLSTVTVVGGEARGIHSNTRDDFLKYNYYYPIRDAFDPNVWAALGDPAQPRPWNLTADGDVPSGSFFNNAPPADTATPPADGAFIAPPTPPWTIETRKKSQHAGTLDKFIARDAAGRRFMLRLSPAEHPHALAAAVVAARLIHRLGYHVPGSFLVTISGTGDASLDGRTAEATEFFTDGVLGNFRISTLRYRREMRAYRIVAAWLNDVDRCDGNTLVVRRDGVCTYYFIDFDSVLGLWQGRPGAAWRGRRHAWDPLYVLLHPIPPWGIPSPRPAISPNVSPTFTAECFDPMTFCPSQPNAAFRFMTRDDAVWIARRIQRISPAEIRSIARAVYPSAAEADAVAEVLIARRQIILDRFLTTAASPGSR